jgi:hypothetical protein
MEAGLMINLQNLSDARRYTLLFLVQFVIILACFGIIKVKYTENIMSDKHVAEVFSVTNCTIVAKQLVTKDSMLGTGYRADFELSYVVDGVVTQSTCASNGLDYSYTSDLDSQNEFIDEYKVGTQYSCWYDPANPQTVVLVLRHSWTSAFPLFIPSIIMVIMLIYMLGTVARLMELYIMGRRAKNKKKK